MQPSSVPRSSSNNTNNNTPLPMLRDNSLQPSTDLPPLHPSLPTHVTTQFPSDLSSTASSSLSSKSAPLKPKSRRRNHEELVLIESHRWLSGNVRDNLPPGIIVPQTWDDLPDSITMKPTVSVRKRGSGQGDNDKTDKLTKGSKLNGNGGETMGFTMTDEAHGFVESFSILASECLILSIVSLGVAIAFAYDTLYLASMLVLTAILILGLYASLSRLRKPMRLFFWLTLAWSFSYVLSGVVTAAKTPSYIPPLDEGGLEDEESSSPAQRCAVISYLARYGDNCNISASDPCFEKCVDDVHQAIFISTCFTITAVLVVVLFIAFQARRLSNYLEKRSHMMKRKKRELKRQLQTWRYGEHGRKQSENENDGGSDEEEIEGEGEDDDTSGDGSDDTNSDSGAYDDDDGGDNDNDGEVTKGKEGEKADRLVAQHVKTD